MHYLEYLQQWWEAKNKRDQKVTQIVAGVFFVTGVLIGAVLS